MYFATPSNQEEANPISTDEKFSILSNTIKSLKMDQGWVCLVDLVLNHAARNADWVVEHPEVTYNL